MKDLSLSNSTEYYEYRQRVTANQSLSSQRPPAYSAKHSPFIVGHYYRRQAIHDKFGGNRHAGISTSSAFPFIFLFTDFKRGSLAGYNDEWDPCGIFVFTGEEQKPDELRLVRGNAAVRNHIGLNKRLMLFSVEADGYVKFLGEVVYKSHFSTTVPDKFGEAKPVVKFRIIPIDQERFSLAHCSDRVESQNRSGELANNRQDGAKSGKKKRRKKILRATEPLVVRTQE